MKRKGEKRVGQQRPKIKKTTYFVLAMICLTIICISPIFIGQWLIQRQAEANPNYDTPTGTKCTCNLETKTTYNGKAQDIKENSVITDVLGTTDFETADKAGIAFKFITYKFANPTGFTDANGNAITETTADFKAGSTTISFANDVMFKWAGTYVFEIVDNVTGQVLCPHHEYVIGQATAQGNVTVNSETGYYKNDIAYTVSWAGVNNEKISYNTTLEAPTGDKLEKNTFTAASFDTTNGAHLPWLNNYLIAAPQGSYSLLPVAKIGSTNYATINAALNAASGTTTVNVLVLGSTVDNGVAKDAKTISTTIKSGVTLFINYADGNNNTYEEIDEAIKSANIATTVTCTNRVFISGDVVNNGTIVVPAKISGLQSTNVSKHGDVASSIVYGSHSIIECLKNEDGTWAGSITSSGTITCFGYIEGNVTLTGGSMMTLFSFLDHRGGTALSNLAGLANDQKTFPIKRYYIASVKGQVQVNPGASLVGRAFITVSASILGMITKYDDVTMIGTGSSGFVGLSTNSRVTLSYNENATNSQYVNAVHIYGDAAINNISVSVDATIVKISMDSTDSMIPIPYLWEVGLHTYPGKTTATINTGDNDIALLPGTKCVVDTGVTLNADRVAIYTTGAPLDALNVTCGGTTYSTKYGDAELLIYGTLNANELGGVVTAGSSNAKITYDANSVTYREASASDGTATSPVTQYLTGQIMQNTTEDKVAYYSALDDFPTTGTYFGTAIAGSTHCGWRPEKIKITIHRNDGTTTTQTVGPTDLSIGGYDVSKLTASRDYYDFQTWHDAASGGKELRRLFKDTDIYAQWDAIEYTISYAYLNPSGAPIDIPSPGISSMTYTREDVASETTLIALPENAPRPEGISDVCTLAGWFSGNTPVSASEFTFAKLAELAGKDAALTLTGKWTEKFYTVTLNLGTNPYNLSAISLPNNTAFSFALGYHFEGDSTIQNQVALHNGTTTDASKKQYFVGWYVDKDGDGTAESRYDTSYAPEGDAFTLYAKWGTKATLTVNYGTNNLNYVGETVYIMPGETYELSDITAGDGDKENNQYSNGWTKPNTVTIDGTTATLNCADAATITLTANWSTKVQLLISYGSTADNTNFNEIADIAGKYFIPGTKVDISALVAESTKEDDNPSINKYFGSWAITGTATLNDTELTLTSGNTVTLTAQWQNKVNLIIDYDHTGYFNNRTDLYFKPGETVRLTDYITNVVKYDKDLKVNKYFNQTTPFVIADGSAEIISFVSVIIADDASGSVTVKAQWLEKTTTLQFTSTNNVNAYADLFKEFDSNFAYGTTYYFHPDDTTITLPVLTTYDGKTTEDSQIYYFNGWTLNSGSLNNGASSCTLTANTANTINVTWGTKVTVTFSDDVTHFEEAAYYKPGTVVSVPLASREGWTVEGDKAYIYTFNGWVNGNDTKQPNTAFAAPSASITYTASVTAAATYNKVSITLSNTSLSVTGGTWKNSSGEAINPPSTSGTEYYLLADSTTITISATPNNNYKDPKISINGGSNVADSTTATAKDLTSIRTSATYNVCFVEGTLITLADGTQKRIEDLTFEDELLVFDHTTGKFSAQKLLFLAHKDEPAANHRVITLVFSNGDTVSIVGDHGFYNLTLNKYTYLEEANVAEYIGHKFYSASYSADGTLVEEAVTLVGYSVTEEYTKVYSPMTNGSMNCFAGNMLTIPPILFLTDGFANMFEYDENMKYDEEKMMADIEKYGLFTYEDFKDYYTYEEFTVTNTAIFKVAVGKGYLTWEECLIIVDYVKSNALFDHGT